MGMETEMEDGMTAKPMLGIGAMAFWTAAIAALTMISYQAGFDHGTQEGRQRVAKCPDRSEDGKALKSSHLADGQTTCVYSRDYGSSKWKIKV